MGIGAWDLGFIMRIAIIGAGISGLYLAWKLSEKGESVTVFEKKEEIGQGVCSGLFSNRILEFIPESRKLIQNKINLVLLHFPKKTITIRFSKNFFVMPHSGLDKLVADLAQKAGAKIVLNHNISFLPRDYERIIGCDGANSFIRRSLNLPEPTYRLGTLGFVKESSFSDCVETWPCQGGFTPHFWKQSGGFIWKIPRGDEIEYGIIAGQKEAKKLLSEFLIQNNISLERIKSKIVPQGFVIPSNSSITLCGDAAGLAKPWSGGGVIWGLYAAEILLKSFPDLLRYKKTMQRFFIPKIIFSKFATKTIYFLGFKMPWLLPKKTKIESDFLL